MRLTLDLGNSRLSLALLHEGRVVAHRVLDAPRTAREVDRALDALAARSRGTIRAAALSSVVPEAAPAVVAAVRRRLGIAPLLFPKDAPGLLRVRPRPAPAVGADRLANALAALALVDEDAIVVDVGTAATVDLVRRRGSVFEGGMIAPGPRLGARSLASMTAQLPAVPFAPARSPLGRSTRAAIGAGLWFGFRALVQGLVDAVKDRAPRAEIVVAGGDGIACMERGRHGFLAVPDLTHLGLDRALELTGAPR